MPAVCALPLDNQQDALMLLPAHIAKQKAEASNDELKNKLYISLHAVICAGVQTSFIALGCFSGL